jgi:hypothetical protein
MSHDESISLTTHVYDKLGVYHCDVPYDGHVVVAGDPRDIADGESIFFERTGITAKRSGDKYIFSRQQQSLLAEAS